MTMIKLVIADDHKMFRESLAKIISREQISQVTGEAASGEELLQLIQKQEVDIILMDISMPGMGGFEATRQAIRLQPKVKVIALSSLDTELDYYKMVDAGAQGFVLKNAGINELRHAITEVAEGRTWFSSELLQKIIQSIKKNPKENSIPELTDRETEILQLICESLTNSEIAKRINVSYDTVKWHRANLLSKTGSTNTAGLVIYAIKNKLIDI
jgi:DNA-binding NarL/FixJ family response regulator